MRSVCEALFKKHLNPAPGRPNGYIQTGQTMVMIESRQWKLAYSPLEKVVFDLTDENAIVLEVPGDHGVHLVPWHVIIRITISSGGPR
jgi:hypothetical protein